jgi:hypothetical protein
MIMRSVSVGDVFAVFGLVAFVQDLIWDRIFRKAMIVLAIGAVLLMWFLTGDITAAPMMMFASIVSGLH